MPNERVRRLPRCHKFGLLARRFEGGTSEDLYQIQQVFPLIPLLRLLSDRRLVELLVHYQKIRLEVGLEVRYGSYDRSEIVNTLSIGATVSELFRLRGR